MTSCDFSRSFVTFVTKGRGNNARIQVEARCELTDREDGSTEDFHLVASCKGEDTYGDGVLFLDPSYDFWIIYSSSDCRIIRTYANAKRDQPTVRDNLVDFLDVQFHVSMCDAEELVGDRAIVEATLANRVLNGRTEFESPDGRYKVRIEYPIKTMNGTTGRWTRARSSYRSSGRRRNGWSSASNWRSSLTDGTATRTS